MGPGGFVVRSFARSLGVLVAPRVFRAPEGPAAREARASLRSAPRLEARPCPPVPPAPFTPVVPGVLACGLARCLVARPGPAAAHGHRSQAPRFAARPCPPVPPAPSAPVGPGVLAYGLARRLEAWPGPAAAHGHRSQAPRFAARPCPPVPPAPSAPVVPGRCCLVRRVLLQTSSIRAAFCADFPALVTNVVNPTAFLRKIVVFGLRLTTFVTRVLTEGFKMRQFDDVCNASLPSAVSPCPVGDAVAADWGGSGGFAALGAGCRRVAGVSHL